MAIPFLNRLLIGGTPAADGELGRDATLKALSAYDNGMLGTIARTVARGIGTEAFTNSVTSDQDFATLYTFPANTIFTNKFYLVTVMIEAVTGASSATATLYLKLGSTKVMILGSTNMGDSTTRSFFLPAYIVGRAAAGAAADVSTAPVGIKPGDGLSNTVNQPVALATNAALDLILGVTFSATGGTESIQLQGWSVKEE